MILYVSTMIDLRKPRIECMHPTWFGFSIPYVSIMIDLEKPRIECMHPTWFKAREWSNLGFLSHSLGLTKKIVKASYIWKVIKGEEKNDHSRLWKHIKVSHFCN